jgi:hypothetical protein
MEMRVTGPIEEAEEQLPIAIAYAQEAYEDLRRVRREKKQLVKLLKKIVAKEKHIQECIDSCELDIERFQETLERGL